MGAWWYLIVGGVAATLAASIAAAAGAKAIYALDGPRLLLPLPLPPQHQPRLLTARCCVRLVFVIVVVAFLS